MYRGVLKMGRAMTRAFKKAFFAINEAHRLCVKFHPAHLQNFIGNIDLAQSGSVIMSVIFFMKNLSDHTIAS